MDITFTCESCGQSIVIDEAGAGLATECPTCGEPLTVPSQPQGQAEPSAATPPATESAIPPETKTPLAVFCHVLNYSEDPIASAYFDAREHHAYYRSLKHADKKRDFHPRLTNSLSRLLERATDQESLELLAALIAEWSANQSKEGVPVVLGVDSIRNNNPWGVDLMELPQPLDLPSLKSAYRSAAKKHHPDRGGNDEDMKAINDAYSKLHKVLCEQLEAIGSQVVAEPGIEEDPYGLRVSRVDCFMYALSILLIEVHLDDWAVDLALDWARRIESAGWLESHCARRASQRLHLAENYCKLATRLALASKQDDAAYVLERARRYRDDARRGGLYPGNIVERTEKTLGGEGKNRIILNHPRQAENALRLGIISQLKFDALSSTFAEQAAEYDQRESDLAAFLRGGGFLSGLPTEGEFPITPPLPAEVLVPEPEYYHTDYRFLTKDQQSEYRQAFSTQTSVHLIQKYLFVRLHSYLRSMIYAYSDSIVKTVGRECSFLKSIQKTNASAPFCIGGILRACAYLQELSRDEREERLRLLRELDRTSAERSQRSMPGFQISGGPQDFFSLYFEKLFLPLDRLRLAERTGSPETKEEVKQEMAVWNHDLALIGQLRPVQVSAFEALNKWKENPQQLVDVLTDYCEKLLTVGKEITHTQELQIGYWINKLSAALVREKQWNMAEYWLSLFFSLPERYRQRSCESELLDMEKRLNRCRAILSERERDAK